MAANTTIMSGSTINITLAGDVDWAWDSVTEIASVPQLKQLSNLGYLFIDSIEYNPNAPDDTISIREIGLDGPVIYYASGQDTHDQRLRDFNGSKVNGIYIDKDDVASYDDGATVIIRLK